MKNKKLKGFDERIWDYLRGKLSFLKDGNKTAKEIFNYVDRLKRQEIGMDRIINEMDRRRREKIYVYTGSKLYDEEMNEARVGDKFLSISRDSNLKEKGE